MRFAGFCLLILVCFITACSTTFSPFPKTEEHIVGSGDTLYSIAFEHDLDYRELAEWNGIRPPYKIYTGQMLVLHPYHPLAKDSVYESGQDREKDKPRESKVSTKPLSAPESAEVRKVEVKPMPPAAPAKTPSPGSTPAGEPEQTDAKAVAAEGNQADTRDSARDKTQVSKAEPVIVPMPEAPPAPSPKQQVIPKYDDPWIWPVRGTLLDKFSSTNKGLDIGGKPGEPIKASAAGKVVYAGEGLKGYGLLLIVKHDENYLSAYGHNERLLVVQGEAVKQGQHIATVGRGPENQPMLHFEIRRNGKPVNPESLLPK